MTLLGPRLPSAGSDVQCKAEHRRPPALQGQIGGSFLISLLLTVFCISEARTTLDGVTVYTHHADAKRAAGQLERVCLPLQRARAVLSDQSLKRRRARAQVLILSTLLLCALGKAQPFFICLDFSAGWKMSALVWGCAC